MIGRKRPRFEAKFSTTERTLKSLQPHSKRTIESLEWIQTLQHRRPGQFGSASNSKSIVNIFQECTRTHSPGTKNKKCSCNSHLILRFAQPTRLSRGPTSDFKPYLKRPLQSRMISYLSHWSRPSAKTIIQQVPLPKTNIMRLIHPRLRRRTTRRNGNNQIRCVSQTWVKHSSKSSDLSPKAEERLKIIMSRKYLQMRSKERRK